jgi:hypothetical protein
MINQQHPISVPQKLLNQWCRWKPEQTPEYLWRKIADNAAQWGADQELEACCEWAKQFNYDDEYYQDKLRAARRPKPPSLKEQALNQLDTIQLNLNRANIYGANTDTIRKALEQLND